jgi:hypothetical protein
MDFTQLHAFTELYAVPGADSMIDGINPQTGRTFIQHETEAEIVARYPGAVRMTWDAYQAAKIARQQTPITWAPTTQAHYDEMLNVLPPAAMWEGAFLVGEPSDHCAATGRPRYEACWQRGDAYFVGSRPMTRPELRHALTAARAK